MGSVVKFLKIDNSRLTINQVERECQRFIRENIHCHINKSIKTKKHNVVSILLYKNGKLHNEQGPAVVKITQTSGRKEYYMNGEKMNYNTWLNKNFPEKNLKIVK